METDMPLKTDSMTFKNWALHGSGASLTIGVRFFSRYSILFTRRTSARNLFDECQDAASHEKYTRRQPEYFSINVLSRVIISSVSFFLEKKCVT
jgi:hypothetical protein